MYSFLFFASLICLATPVENAFSIVQPYRTVATDGVATVECLYASGPRNPPEEVHVRLEKGLHERATVCGGYVNTTHRNTSTQEPNACRIAMGDKGLSITILRLKGDDTDMYRCVVQIMYPPPYLRRVGNSTLVYVPGEREPGLLLARSSVTYTEKSQGTATGSGPGDEKNSNPGGEAGLEDPMGGAPLNAGGGSGDSDSPLHHLSDRWD